MNTQNFSALQLLQSFFRDCKSLLLQSCPDDLTSFSAIECYNWSEEFRKSEEDIKWQNFKTTFHCFPTKAVGSKKTRPHVQKKVTTHKKIHSSCPEPFILIWSSLFSVLLLCTTTTRVGKQNQIQSKNFQIIKLKKWQRTKWTRLRTKNWKSCLPN